MTTKSVNEIKKLHNALNDISSLARENKSVSKYGDMPKTFISEFNERRKKNSETV